MLQPVRRALALVLLTGTAHAEVASNQAALAEASRTGMPAPGQSGITLASEPRPSSHSAHQAEMMQSTARMNRDLTAAHMTSDPDLVKTTPHRQSAIVMTRLYLRDSRSPMLRRVAQRSIATSRGKLAISKPG